MKRKTIRALGLANRQNLPRPVDLAGRLRRIRTELAHMLAAVDDGLQRIEITDPSPRNRVQQTAKTGRGIEYGGSSES